MAEVHASAAVMRCWSGWRGSLVLHSCPSSSFRSPLILELAAYTVGMSLCRLSASWLSTYARRYLPHVIHMSSRHITCHPHVITFHPRHHILSMSSHAIHVITHHPHVITCHPCHYMSSHSIHVITCHHILSMSSHAIRVIMSSHTIHMSSHVVHAPTHQPQPPNSLLQVFVSLCSPHQSLHVDGHQLE